MMKRDSPPSLHSVSIYQTYLLCESLSATFMSNPEIGNDDDVPTVANVKHANYVDWDNE